jgi:hypothetical protein
LTCEIGSELSAAAITQLDARVTTAIARRKAADPCAEMEQAVIMQS